MEVVLFICRSTGCGRKSCCRFGPLVGSSIEDSNDNSGRCSVSATKASQVDITVLPVGSKVVCLGFVCIGFFPQITTKGVVTCVFSAIRNKFALTQFDFGTQRVPLFHMTQPWADAIVSRASHMLTCSSDAATFF